MQWHDIFGAILTDFFAGSAFVVETEVDLSLKKQLLDFVIIRRLTGKFDRPLPDGFGPLADHNLISFKSHQGTFDGWALLELIGHFVSYRKKVSPDFDNLVPLSEFRVIGITARHPENLAREFTLVDREPGVYDINCGPLLVHILVIRDMRDSLVNAMLKLFSIVPSQIEFACHAYQQ